MVRPDRALAYLLGFAIGDGSFALRSISLHQAVHEEEFLEVLRRLLASLSVRYGGAASERVEDHRVVDLAWSNSTIARTMKFLGRTRYYQVRSILRGMLSADFIAGFWEPMVTSPTIIHGFTTVVFDS